MQVGCFQIHVSTKEVTGCFQTYVGMKEVTEATFKNVKSLRNNIRTLTYKRNSTNF